MEISIKFRENKKIEAHFGNFVVLSDQTVSSGGDGEMPEPFDYFLSGTALCAAFYIRSYCERREIPIDQIEITQDNIKVDESDRYKQCFHLKVKVPDSVSEKDRVGIMRSAGGCSVKKVMAKVPEFKVEVI